MFQFTVGAYLPEKDINEYPFTKEEYRQSYFELSTAVARIGGQLLIVKNPESYLGQGRFSYAWEMHSPDEYLRVENVALDVVYDKGQFPSDATIPIFNHQDLHVLCTDKFQTYSVFPEYSPKTFAAKTREELLIALSKISTSKVVIKPTFGYEGKGVVIDSPNRIDTESIIYPVIVQEFIDTSRGIPGIVDGFHDLRVALFDGEVIYSYVRTPPPGKFTANVAQGGIFFMLSPEKLPAEIITIIRSIDKKLAYVGPRFYGVDFGITAQGPLLIEMNSRLGLLPNRDAPEFAVLKDKLANAFKQLALHPSIAAATAAANPSSNTLGTI